MNPLRINLHAKEKRERASAAVLGAVQSSRVERRTETVDGVMAAILELQKAKEPTRF